MDYTEAVKNTSHGSKLAKIYTFGCQQNENDSEKIAGILHEMGYGLTDDVNRADFVVFNTCAIRENAEKRVYGILGSLKHLKEIKREMIIALCGCMANEEHNREKIKKTFTWVDIVFGTNSLHRLPKLLYERLQSKRQIFYEDEDSLVHEGIKTLRQSKIRAGIPIMYGCNNFCSYCIVPYVRGRERSRAEDDIIKEVIDAKNDGCKEVMLLGQNVNSFGGGGDSFAHLLERVSDTGIPRIRFMTSHPKDISESVIKVMSERENICNSLHLPLQSGSSKVLGLMNRKYTKQWYLDKVDMIKRYIPDIALTTDIIVGFPGETTADFEETLDVLEKVRFDMIYSFIFSPRRGTPAERMEDVISDTEKKKNFDRMLEIQNGISLEKNKALEGKTEYVLAEGESKTNSEFLSGRTESNKTVNFKGDISLAGEMVKVLITEAGTFSLTGELI